MFIRPARHTFGFANEPPLFTLSFFDELERGAGGREALNICGVKSGRDTDKAAEAKLTSIVFEKGPVAGAVGFAEAREIIVCRKIYTHDFDPAFFLDAPGIEKHLGDLMVSFPIYF